jgi:serine/threonine-protein kinase
MSAAEKTTLKPAIQTGYLLAQRYRIQTLLGFGGMGEVYDAYDERLERAVAVKILPLARSRSEEHIERFQRQADVATRIPHPGIVQIYDSGIDGEIHYIVMERLVGQELSRIISQHSPLSVTFAVDVAVQIARATHAAHRQGVIHRDLKPSNILLTRGENDAEIVKILDFGVAKIKNNFSLTQTEEVMGTPTYMSPEQLKSSKYIDARADVYSIGCILYEMLTGHPPFVASSEMELVLKIKNDPPEPINRRRRDIPDKLASIVEKTMAKDPAERFATAHLLANALEQIDTVLDHNDRSIGVYNQPESTPASGFRETSFSVSERLPSEYYSSKSTIVTKK